MLPISDHTPFPTKSPRRVVRRRSDKIFFLSLEGRLTEEEYFALLPILFSIPRNKIRIISVAEDANPTATQTQTAEQNQFLSRNSPLDLVQRIDQYKSNPEKQSEFQFELHKDEFWIITDVDKNWDTLLIENWNNMVRQCEEKGYHYAVSNPFFEVWLLLHYDDPTDEDKAFAVTDTHGYQPTSHFRERLRALNRPLRKNKSIRPENFNETYVRDAIMRAKNLHDDKNDLSPRYFASTVYILIEKILALAVLPG